MCGIWVCGGEGVDVGVEVGDMAAAVCFMRMQCACMMYVHMFTCCFLQGLFIYTPICCLHRTLMYSDPAVWLLLSY